MINTSSPDWLSIRRGESPLLLSIPHAGTDLVHVASQVMSPWLARMDADWYVDRLYDFAAECDATIVSTSISRSVIDVNRDPTSRNLYPGMATTELVPTTTFDGVPLYEQGRAPDEAEQAVRRQRYYDPYHETLRAELDRIKSLHGSVVLYDAHSIRSRVPRLFEGELPIFNIGTYDGRSCSPELVQMIERVCAGSTNSYIVNGRFKGGWITREYGRPGQGIHAVQMELACRAYMTEPDEPLNENNWPPIYSAEGAAGTRDILRDVLEGCVEMELR
ncbi:MAG TPA: N-formylglutamate deformylase [Steroidobacteraceae bacterium]|nr:N-formylglutamate deformylase [Steroidobacteraceae bacterium]